MFVSLFRWLLVTMETAVVPFLVLSFVYLRYVVRHYDIDPLIYQRSLGLLVMTPAGEVTEPSTGSIDPVPVCWREWSFRPSGRFQVEEFPQNSSLAPVVLGTPPQFPFIQMCRRQHIC